MKNIRRFFREYTGLIICVLLFIFFQFAVTKITDTEFSIFSGVFLGFQYAVCLLMMRTKNKVGIITAVVLFGLNLLFLAYNILFREVFSAVPGFVNMTLYLVTLIILYFNYRQRETESITDLTAEVLNRRGFYQETENRISLEEDFGLVYITMENFKVMSDNYGHNFSDRLLKLAAERLGDRLEKNDRLARLDGSEFALILSDSRDIQKRADEMLEALRKKFLVKTDGTEISCHMYCYAGISKYPELAKDFRSVIQTADSALSEAVSRKSKTALYFDGSMLERMKRQIKIQELIKEGLANGYFFMMYQPQYVIEEKKLRGFEALLRLKTPDGEFISPGEFIPVAEKGELILEIDNYVLEHAMTQFREAVLGRSYVLSINVSAKNIASSGFYDRVAEIIRKTDFPAENLEIEITEYCMADSMEITIDNINRLREIGVQIALDDFGTGYTSLSYVAKLPVNLIKIDKSLVDDIAESQKSQDFVKTIISMGHLMGCDVIAEGVEHTNQLDRLRENQCDFVQGYIWSRPLEFTLAKELADRE